MEQGIRGRWFSDALAPLGGDFLVDDAPFQRDTLEVPPVAVANVHGDSEVVVAWSRSTGGGPEDDYYNVHARRYSASGDAIGQEFQMNADTPGLQQTPILVGSTENLWLAAWQHFSFDPPSESVRLQFFDGASPVGGQFDTNTPQYSKTQDAQLAAATDGTFYGIWGAQTLGGDMVLIGSKLDPSSELDPKHLTYDSSANIEPAMAALPNGNLLVVWYCTFKDGTSGLAARVFDSAFSALSPQRSIWTDPNPKAVRDKYARLAVSPTGEHAVVVWELGDRRQNQDDRDVVGLLIDDTGAPIGNAFSLSEVTAGTDQFAPSVTYVKSDQFVAAWSSNTDAQQLYLSRVIARRFAVGSLTPRCGDSNDDGFILASDGLAALRAAVGLSDCPLCLCDANGSGAATAADALAILQTAVGLPVPLQCPDCSEPQ